MVLIQQTNKNSASYSVHSQNVAKDTYTSGKLQPPILFSRKTVGELWKEILPKIMKRLKNKWTFFSPNHKGTI